MSNLETTNKNLAITASELKTSLEAKDKPIIFDLGDMHRYELGISLVLRTPCVMKIQEEYHATPS